MKTLTLIWCLLAFLTPPLCGDETGLSPDGKELSNIFTKLKADPDNKILQFRYLQQFPNTCSQFKKLFDPEDFSELYDGYEYIFLLEDLSRQHPSQVGCILIDLSKEAEWSADAFNYLQEVTASFALSHTPLLVEILNTYEVHEQSQVITFLADGIHSPADGYFEIIEQLKKLGENSLARSFEEIDQKVSSARKHDED